MFDTIIKELGVLIKNHFTEFIIALSVLVIIKAVLSLLITSCTKKKGYKEFPVFIMCFVLGIYGYIIAAALPDKRIKEFLEKEARTQGSPQVRRSTGLIAHSNDRRSPHGAVAYMPDTSDLSARRQDRAVERIKDYWTAADDRTAREAAAKKSHSHNTKKEKNNIKTDNEQTDA